MSADYPIVLSASRRTDIPAFYMEWFMKRVEIGTFEIVNPYNHKIKIVECAPQKIHTMVFWSKNFDLFLKQGYGENLVKRGYNLFFNFTINSMDSLLEPNVPPIDVRLTQLAELAERFGPNRIQWRFDPICFYEMQGEKIHNNRADFLKIAESAAASYITVCITSFVDLYAKIRKRIEKLSHIRLFRPSMENQVTTVIQMENQLAEFAIQLHLCCEKEIIAALPDSSQIKASSCIPTLLLMELGGGQLSKRRDQGQRRKKGCQCGVSVDVGIYHLHPCYHNCLFCYANPAAPFHLSDF